MIMQAVVIEVQWEQLLVLDLDTRQRVIVNTPDARFFRPDDFVRIWYSGAMTKSIPPQINALRITVISSEPLPPVRPPAPCPPAICPPVVRPPVIFPPVVRPPIGRPPAGRPPLPPQRPRPPRPRTSGRGNG